MTSSPGRTWQVIGVASHDLRADGLEVAGESVRTVACVPTGMKYRRLDGAVGQASASRARSAGLAVDPEVEIR